jgi:hypothetical protein
MTAKRPAVEVLENEAPTASARILADANHIEHQTDKRGRKIGVKKLEFIDIHKLTKVIGGDTASNQIAFAQVLAAASVVEIDGEMVPRPGTNLQIDALMTRLGLAGIEAATKTLERLNADSDEAVDEIKN